MRLHACRYMYRVCIIWNVHIFLCVSLSRVGGVVCRGVCVYVWLGPCMCVGQRQRGMAVGGQAGGQQVVL